MLDVIEAGELDIAADASSAAFRAQFHAGLDEVLRNSRARATAIRAKHPAARRQNLT